MDEQQLSKDEIAQVFELFRESIKDYAKDREHITSTDMKRILEDSIDRVKQPRAFMMVDDEEPSRTTEKTALTQYSGTTSTTGVSGHTANVRRIVDIYADPGI